MMHRVRGLGLAATLVFFAPVAVVPKARAASTPSTVAHVYIQVQGPEGAVYGYSASSTGKLSAISGSPFKLGTAIVGSTPTKFFTLGQTLLHSYKIGSNGAIGSQLGRAPIYDYSGSECGDSTIKEYQEINGAVLDHTGKYVYVLLQNGPNNCAAYQTYAIGSDGAFTFKGDIEQTGINIEPVTTSLGLPSILSNETFGYGTEQSGHNLSVIGFRRESTGALQWLQFTETDPPLNDNYWAAASPDASPSGNYVAIQLYPGDSSPSYLGSYTVDSKGNLSTTNTTSNMPIEAGDFTKFAPSGKLLANWGGLQQGITLYHFNGAAPLTLYKTLLSGATIDQVAWDSSNHLYAISRTGNKLYVLTVTPTSTSEDTSISIGSPLSLIVVSQ
ncbi:MAG TPA: hypothetical protein VLZ50_11975 [Terracidiphilus sp.]|nr:hypothetical protein [Terracidiphilus sp.]